jgi:hypothetical protein
MDGSIGKWAVVCQERTWDTMLRSERLRWKSAFRVLCSAMNARGSKLAICSKVALCGEKWRWQSDPLQSRRCSTAMIGLCPLKVALDGDFAPRRCDRNSYASSQSGLHSCQRESFPNLLPNGRMPANHVKKGLTSFIPYRVECPFQGGFDLFGGLHAFSVAPEGLADLLKRR